MSMRRIKEILRLKYELGLENRQIARSCSVPHSTVGNYLKRAETAGVCWPLPAELDGRAVEERLFPEKEPRSSCRQPLPDWTYIHRERHRHRHLTLQLLWQEYKQDNPEGYQYSRFCELYGDWARRLDLVLRQDYRGGEKLFVDYAGQTIPIIHGQTGQARQASIFVAVLGASNYTYAEASERRDLAAWIGAHNRAAGFFGGVASIVVPDNCKTGVKTPCYYEPDLNPTYRDWAEHYGTVIIPARVRKPRDKAKVETGVLIVERWILAALRKRTFFSLAELNQAIAGLLAQLNDRRFRKLNTTRRRLFEEVDRPALKSLPAEPFQFAEWKKVRVHRDYHVEVDRHYYSVPYQFVHEQLEARTTESTVEVFRCGRRLVTHARSFVPGRHTTLAEHRPPCHQNLEWTSDRVIRTGRVVGEATAAVLERIMQSRPHPELGYRSCLGVLRLGDRYTRERLEAASRRALALNACSYRSLKSILAAGLDRQPAEPLEAPSRAHQATHVNVRGASYYGPEEVG
jgi:transposase